MAVELICTVASMAILLIDIPGVLLTVMVNSCLLRHLTEVVVVHEIVSVVVTQTCRMSKRTVTDDVGMTMIRTVVFCSEMISPMSRRMRAKSAVRVVNGLLI